MNELPRRTLLGAIGAGSTIAAAGCVDTFRDSEPDEARLSILEVRNMWGEADIEVDVTVEAVDGETVFSDTWEIERGSRWGEGTVATERGQYIASAEVGDLREEVDVVEAADGEDVCVGIEFQTGTDDDGVPNTITSSVYGHWDDC